jgi:opacity protein-like surface antigen
MKKIIIAAFFAASIITTAFAADASKVSLKVMDNFKKQFRNAAKVEWTIKEQFTKANFNVNGIAVEAFFDKEGELIGTSRHSDFNQLPMNAIEQIQREYANYQVSSTIEFDQKGDRNYYVSIEKGNKKQILAVSLYGEVSKFEGLGK